tara:strand:- start:999 stop:1919 length:921 start_codon:yes stop_codon:yes gene_type:complete
MKKWFSKLGDNFRKTSSNIKKALIEKKLDESTINKLEEALICSDLGITLTNEIIDDIKSKKFLQSDARNQISEFLVEQFNNIDNKLIFKKKTTPQILLIFGVNGSGKTTTIAKLANKAKKDNLNVEIVAADTFRAAATEQLLEWGKKIGVDVIKGNFREDPSSVVFKAHKNAIEKKIDLLIIDTAGRLHNKKELMEELKKIIRILKKNDESSPHNRILVLDSTIGQNTYNQIESFNDYVGLDGVIMTKLDGSAKGGSLVGVTKKYRIPIYAIGIGENKEDLIDFNAKEFVDALIGNDLGDKIERLH